MMKTAIIASAVIFGAAAPSAPIAEIEPATAEQTMVGLPNADTVVAQFSYLELSHGSEGFSFAVTDTTGAFVDVEFPGDLHIRIGF